MFAFLDNFYVISLPERTHAIFDVVRTSLRLHAGIEIHLGKTKMWNAAGEEPPNTSELQPAADAKVDPMWTGNWALPPERQGLVVLGTPVGRDEYVRHLLRNKRLEHDRLLERVLSSQCLTFNQHGCCCFCVHAPGPITS